MTDMPTSQAQARELLDTHVLPAVRRQASLYHKLADFGPRQDALIASGDGEALMRVLAERQAVVDDLVGVHDSLEAVRQHWRQFVEALADDDRQRLGERLEELKAVAARVQEQDADAKRRLDEAREGLSDEMRGLADARGALRAYGAAGAQPSRRADHRDREA